MIDHVCPDAGKSLHDSDVPIVQYRSRPDTRGQKYGGAAKRACTEKYFTTHMDLLAILQENSGHLGQPIRGRGKASCEEYLGDLRTSQISEAVERIRMLS